MKTRFLIILVTCIIHIAYAQESINTTQRLTQKVSENVYLIRHEDSPNAVSQGNTTVIIGEKSVLVIDAPFLPSSSRKDIQEIKKITNKPVAYLVNSHYHSDHTFGNTVYRDSFPYISIIAQKNGIKMQKLSAQRFPGLKRNYENIKSKLEAGRDQSGKTLTETQKDSLRKELKRFEEFQNYSYTLPNVVFDEELDIDLGNLLVQLRYFGRGNTVGDIVTHVPSLNLVVAGDLIVSPIPYAYLGYPSEWMETLKRISALNPSIIIPGHGNILKGTEYLLSVIDLIQLVVSAVDQQIIKEGHTSRTEKIIKATKVVQAEINWDPWRKRFAGSLKENIEFFDDSIVGGLVRGAFSELEAR